MIIQHNMITMSSLNSWNRAEDKKIKILEKMATGKRINRAGDDAAGLYISQKMKSQTDGLGKACENIQNGASMAQTADGGLNEITAILQRERELVVKSLNDTNVEEDLEYIQMEIEQLKGEIDEIANNTHFNGINLLNREHKEGVIEKVVGYTTENVQTSIHRRNVSNSAMFGITELIDLDAKYLALNEPMPIQYEIELGIQDKIDYYPDTLKGNTAISTVTGIANDQTIRITSGGSSADINITAGMTLGEVSNKINEQFGVNGVGATLHFEGTGTQEQKIFLSTYECDETLGIRLESLTGGVDLSNIGLDALDTIQVNNSKTFKIYEDKFTINGYKIGDMLPDGHTVEKIDDETVKFGEDIEIKLNYYTSKMSFDSQLDMGTITPAIANQRVVEASGNLYINGVAVYLDAGDTVTDVVGKLNAVKEKDFSTSGSELALHSEYGVYNNYPNWITTHVPHLAWEIGGEKLSSGSWTATQKIEQDANLKFGGNAASTLATELPLGYLNPTSSSTIYWNPGNETNTYSVWYDKFEDVDTPIKENVNAVLVEGRIYIQAGANKNQTIEMRSCNVTTQNLKVSNVKVRPRETAEEALERIDKAIEKVSKERAVLGAVMNRFEHANENAVNMRGNLTAAFAKIEDADLALEAVNFEKIKILSQSNSYIVAQANIIPEKILQLLK